MAKDALDADRLYIRFLEISVRSQMQYRASFIMLALGHMAATGIEFAGMLVLFARSGSLLEWSLHEVAFMYGVVNVSFAIADAASRGFDTFGDMVKSGEFDRLLTRPRSTALQVAGQELTLRRVGRLAQGAFVLAWASAGVGTEWSAASAALLALTVIGGACMFSGLIVLQATLAFWTTETLEIMNTVTYGGVETTQYPLSIYRDWFQRFFTFIIPLARVSYFPCVEIIGADDPLGSPTWFRYASPLIGAAFLAAALRVWNLGERRYASTGS